MENKCTVVILTFNEEHNIPSLVENLRGLPVNIFVVDSYSTDNTIALIEAAGIKYVQHPFINYSEQRNWAQDQLPGDAEWVFHIDADERLTKELKEWLKSSFDPDTTETDGFIFGRRALFMGQCIRSHYNYHLRLYRKSMGSCEVKSYDQHFVSTGKSTVLQKKDMESTVCDNLSQFIQSHNKWATFEAIDIINKGALGDVKPRFWGSPIERKRWLKNVLFQNTPLFLRSFLYFFYRYFIQLGFLDGRKGFIFHILQAFWFRFLVDAKVYEIKNSMKKNNISLDEATTFYK